MSREPLGRHGGWHLGPRPHADAPAARAAQEGGQARDAEPAGDQADIQRRTEELIRAFSRGDARELAGFWTDRGEYLHGDDLTIRGRETSRKRTPNT